MAEKAVADQNLEELFKVGAHFGFSKGRRHPSTEDYIFGSKNRVDIIDLERTRESLDKAISYVQSLAETGSKILFVGSKNEAQEIVKSAAMKAEMPYVSSRWIGGTLTNFPEIHKRVETMLDLISQKEKGELQKYTKKERVLIDRKIEKLQKMFWGIKDMSALPKALFIVDPRFELTAFTEARSLNIPVVALTGTDNDISNVQYPITANDTSSASIKYFVGKIADAAKKNG